MPSEYVGRPIILEEVDVDLVAAVGVRGAGRFVVALVVDHELVFGRKEGRGEARVVDDVEGAGDVLRGRVAGVVERRAELRHVVDRPAVKGAGRQSHTLEDGKAGEHRRVIGERDGVGEVGASVGGPGTLGFEPLERRRAAGVDHLLHPLGIEPVDADVDDVLGSVDSLTRRIRQAGETARYQSDEKSGERAWCGEGHWMLNRKWTSVWRRIEHTTTIISALVAASEDRVTSR